MLTATTIRQTAAKPTCPPPKTCGTCKHACDPANVADDGLACTVGKCTPTCQEGFSDCSGSCVSLVSNDNCGACGNACPDGLSCSPEGVCYVSECTLEDGQYASVKVGDKTLKAYCIKDVDTFKEFRNAINNGNIFPNENNEDNAYILMSDIKLYNQVNWAPIGTNSKPFKGSFVGNGHTISGNLTCTSNYCGLIGYDDGANIFNSSATGNATCKWAAGGLIGTVYARGIRVENCVAFGTAKITEGGESAGSLIGYTQVAVNVDQCAAYGDALGAIETGVVIGQNNTATKISNSVFGGASNGTTRSGALFGYNAGTPSTSNIYYWDGNKQEKIVGQGALGNYSTYFKFGYTENVATLSDSPSDALVDVLNASSNVWTSAKCKLTSGPNTEEEYTLPIIKGLTFAHCK